MLSDSTFVPLHWTVNNMDNAMYEIDVYDPRLFMRIADQLSKML